MDAITNIGKIGRTAVISSVLISCSAFAEDLPPLGDGYVRIVGDTAHRLEFAAGAFNVFEGRDEENNDDVSLQGGATLYYGRKFYYFGPMLGIYANTDGGVFGYAGIYADIELGRRWHVIPEGGIGGYRQGNSKDLGGIFQFDLGIGVAYRFDNGARLGLKFTHVSSAGINDPNPGVETLTVTYSVPLDDF